MQLALLVPPAPKNNFSVPEVGFLGHCLEVLKTKVISCPPPPPREAGEIPVQVPILPGRLPTTCIPEQNFPSP